MGLLGHKIILCLDFSLYFCLFALCAWVHMWLEGGMCVPHHMGGDQRTFLGESILCIYHVVTENRQVVRLGRRQAHLSMEPSHRRCLFSCRFALMYAVKYNNKFTTLAILGIWLNCTKCTHIIKCSSSLPISGISVMKGVALDPCNSSFVFSPCQPGIFYRLHVRGVVQALGCS